MNEQELKILLRKDKSLDEKIGFYLKKKILVKQNLSESEIKGHIEKAEHNLNFVKDVLDNYSDWAVVGCYYSLYHISLALILKKGYSSKNHDATLSILIKEYFQKEFTSEDIELLNNAYLNNEDILFYAKSKEEREKASYSTQILFDKKTISHLRERTLLFIRKSMNILNKK